MTRSRSQPHTSISLTTAIMHMQNSLVLPRMEACDDVSPGTVQTATGQVWENVGQGTPRPMVSHTQVLTCARK